VTNPKYIDYKLTMTRIFDEVNTWFRINFLKLNINKTHILQFNSMNCENCGMHNNIGQNFEANPVCIKFLGLNIDNGLTWKNHIDYLVTKLSPSCFIMRTIKSRMSLTVQHGVTGTARHSENIICRGVTGTASHAMLSHSFVYFSTT
jgi:hypothetical protein